METMTVERGMSIFLDVFRRADKKDDGKISWEEFVAFFSDGVMGQDELQALFEEIDTHKTNFIDPRELCEYFSTHLGSFKEIYGLLEDLNTKISQVLVSTSQKYGESSRNDQFVTRFLMSEVMNQVGALQYPLDSATEALDEEARRARPDIVAVLAESFAKKPPSDAIIPGRVVRRAKRQTSNQSAMEGLSMDATGSLARTKQAMDAQVDRLATLLDRMENRLNFDGIVDEEIDSEGTDQLVMLQKEMTVKMEELPKFKAGLRDYIEATNAAPGCLSLTVRSYKGTSSFSVNEVWTTEPQQKSHSGSAACESFHQLLGGILEGETVTRSITFPSSWWKRD